jgi:hypothetical protein
LDGFLQLGNPPEDLEGTGNQGILAAMIRAGLAQVDPARVSGPRGRKPLHSLVIIEVAVLLAPVEFVPRSLVARALDRSALQRRTIFLRPDCVVRWLDSDGLEVPTYPLARFVPR